MSEKQKAFSAGAIVMALLTAMVISITTWIAVQASEVPVLQEQIRVMNLNIVRVNNSLDKIGKFIDEYNHDSTNYQVWKTRTDIKLEQHGIMINRNDLDIEVVGMKCDLNEHNIMECKKYREENS